MFTPPIRTHLASRGGHSSEKKIPAGDIDGQVQSLRLRIAAEDIKYRKKSDKRMDIT